MSAQTGGTLKIVGKATMLEPGGGGGGGGGGVMMSAKGLHASQE